MTTTAGPSSVSPASTLSLLTNLPLAHPSFRPLLESHIPLAHPSSLPTQGVNKLLGRINSAVLSKDNESERKIAWSLASSVVQQDVEGYALTNWAKGWLNAALGALTAQNSILSNLNGPLELLVTVVTGASSYPSFEREAVHPVMGKLAVTLSRLLERATSDASIDWNVKIGMIESTRTIVAHSPASFRAVAPNLRTYMRILTLSLPTVAMDPSSSSAGLVAAPLEARQSAAELIAALPLTAGKAQSSAAWGVAVREAMGGIAAAMDSIVRDGWEEEPVKIIPPGAPAGLPALPAEPVLRLAAALDWLEGFTEELLALLRFSNSRSVPLPIAQIVSAGLRCLNVTLDTPTVGYVSPQHHAALIMALPRIWSCGILSVGALATACEDHLLPHLSSILDHSIWLVERIPQNMSETHLQLVHFHRHIYAIYTSALASVEFTSRLLRSCLSRLSQLLESRPSTGLSAVANGQSAGKRGKKRARGAEDGLIGGLEGRESSVVDKDTVEIILASLQLVPLLHAAPTLAPALLTFSIRLHLSLHLHLASTSRTAFEEPSHLAQLQDGVAEVLEQAVYMTEGDQGTGRGWKSAVLSVLHMRDDRLALLLHPSAPPMHRPQPPLSALHFFAKETEEEIRIRRELGFTKVDDKAEGQDEDVDDEAMELDEPVVQTKSTMASRQPAPVSQPVVPLAASPAVNAIPAATPLSTVEKTVETVLQQPAPTMANAPAVVESVSQVEVSSSATPFMSGFQDKGKSRQVEETIERTQIVSSAAIDDDDEPLPELDSGSSDEDEDEEEDEDIE